jgi:hypothetical protein
MSDFQCRFQELFRFGDAVMLVEEAVSEGVDRRLGGQVTTCMATHAVGHGNQYTV